ncbi:TetR family transcriptional regulator [Stenotrophomonas sp.]|uniref:TetR/AcrR family transcriptional regulator n=1 Tax=Stenotrophomonas sp. TaxID=69392 RepID=UPI0028A1BF74|nr:TetR family transcriptional regulator [Stenotrophomonas sp.]
MNDSLSMPPGLRERKKADTRLMISNVATRLFIARGFEAVSVDEVAVAAGVSRKTVFNYFPRKEDLLFDREEEGRALVRDAIAARGPRSPVHAFQDLMRRLQQSGHPLLRISARPVTFWFAVAASPALTARARELQVTLGDELAALLAAAIGRPPQDPQARLAATLLMGTLVVAYTDALAAVLADRSPEAAFVAVMERGFTGVDAALAGTPLVG